MHKYARIALLLAIAAMPVMSGSLTTAFSLSGKVATVTGGSGAIGRSISRALYERGCTVIVTGRRQEALEALVAEIEASADVVASSGGAGIFAISSDVTGLDCVQPTARLFPRH